MICRYRVSRTIPATARLMKGGRQTKHVHHQHTRSCWSAGHTSLPDLQAERLSRVEAKIKSLNKKLAAHCATPPMPLTQSLQQTPAAQLQAPVQTLGYAQSAHPAMAPERQSPPQQWAQQAQQQSCNGMQPQTSSSKLMSPPSAATQAMRQQRPVQHQMPTAAYALPGWRLARATAAPCTTAEPAAGTGAATVPLEYWGM
jgi:hypothetical protein